MSTDKYPSIFSRQMEAIVYIFSRQMEAIVLYNTLVHTPTSTESLGMCKFHAFHFSHIIIIVMNSLITPSCTRLHALNR